MARNLPVGMKVTTKVFAVLTGVNLLLLFYLARWLRLGHLPGFLRDTNGSADHTWTRPPQASHWEKTLSLPAKGPPNSHWAYRARETRLGVRSSQTTARGKASSQTSVSERPLPPPALPQSLLFVINASGTGRRVFNTSSVAREQKTIFFINRPVWAWEEGDSAFAGCDVDACALTSDRSQQESADAVIFHMCSDLPKRVTFQPYLGQVWIAYGMESPPHCHYYHNPFGRKFNWTMTYRTDSDLFYPYGRFSLRDPPEDKNYTAIVEGKSKAVAWFVSNCYDPAQRQNYARELSRHVPVDIYGACGTFTCPRGQEEQCMRLLNTTYFFYLSFENSLCRDYLTEKVFKLYNDVDVVPVVRGGADYHRYLPPGTFLNTADFHSPRELAGRLKVLMADRQAYADMLRAKDRFSMRRLRPIPALCQLCHKLHGGEPVARTYPDLQQWASQGVCHKAEDLP